MAVSKLAPFSVTCPEFQASPYASYKRLHDGDLIYYDQNLNAYFVGKYRDVKHILTNPVYTTAPLAKRAEPVMRDRFLAQMEGEEHDGKRRMVVRGLHGKSLRERLSALTRKHTEKLLAPYLPIGSVDLVNDFGKQFAVIMTLDMMGLPTGNHKQVAMWLAGIADFVTRLDMDEERRAYDIECSRQLGEYLLPIVQERQRGGGHDMISMLIASKVGGQVMSTSEVLALCLNVLLAASEPVDKTLGLMFKHLLDHPEQFAAVRQDRTLVTNALDETLRLTPPVQLIPRQPCEDVEISGVAVAKDSLVFNLIGAANRDPSVFPDPDRFDIYRGKSDGGDRHLAFGAGTHVCVGAAFSMVELELTAGNMMDMLPDMKYAAGFEYREVGLYTRGPASLRVTFDKRR
jgi:pulcherriminic acid synthase